MLKYPKIPVAAEAEAEGTEKEAEAEAAKIVADHLAEAGTGIVPEKEGIENLLKAALHIRAKEGVNVKVISFS